MHGISIGTLTGRSGLINQANSAKESSRGAELQERIDLTAVQNEKFAASGQRQTTKNDLISEFQGEGKLTADEVSELQNSDTVQIGEITVDFSDLMADDGTITNKIVDLIGKPVPKKTVAEDVLGNKIVIPKGFKIAADSGTTVKEGIVIEDNETLVDGNGNTRGNQYVWIPVSNIDGSDTNSIKIDESTSKVITLGRYTFDETTGVETLVQKGSEYAKTTLDAVNAGTVAKYKVGDYYELKDSRISVQSDGLDGTNTTAKDLAGFISSVETNHGYYIARYEASYGIDEKANSIVSKGNPRDYSHRNDTLTEGMLWNFITQGDAASKCQNLYTTVNSDLINSYMWDTAIVYIQVMGHNNYANQKGKNTSLVNTGKNGDEVCKINDMASNVWEWTTECSTFVYRGEFYPCVGRGR